MPWKVLGVTTDAQLHRLQSASIEQRVTKKCDSFILAKVLQIEPRLFRLRLCDRKTMERKADLREPVKPLPTAEDLRRAYMEIASSPGSTNRETLQVLTNQEETTVLKQLKQPLTIDDLRRAYIKIAYDPVATVRQRLRALITYEKLSGFDKPQEIEDAVASDPLADIQG